MEFGRLITAMVTPFDANGEIDDAALKRVINHLIATGTTAIVVSGTTGESPTLSHDEKLQLFERTMAYVDGRVPVIAGTGSNNTRDSIQLSKEAEALGVNGLLLVAPYYNRPTQEGLYAHFATIADALDLPIMLYNVPARTSVNMSPQTTLRLAEIPHVFAVKEASGDFSQITQLAAEKPDDFLLYSGDDKFTLPMMALGAYGVVSVASHVVGVEMTKMMDAFLDGDHVTAATWSGRLLPIFEGLFASSSPGPVKAALHAIGVPAGSVRLPLVPAPTQVVERLERELERLGKRAVSQG